MRILVAMAFFLSITSCQFLGESEIDSDFIFSLPSDGIVFWFDASTDENMTYDTASYVSYWNESSEMGAYMSCTTTFPEYQANLQNGLGGLVAATSPSCYIYHSATDVSAGALYTFFVVSKINTDGVAIYPFEGFVFNTQTDLAGFSTETADSGDLMSLGVTTFELSNSTSLSVYRNSELVVDTLTVTGTVTSGSAAAFTSFDSNSAIFEMIYFNRWLSQGERAAVENYLMSKWGI